MAADSSPDATRDHTAQRLAACGIPEEKLAQLPIGLVEFVKDNRPVLMEVVAAITPTEDDVLMTLHEAEASGSANVLNKIVRDQFQERFTWLTWLMFEDEPRTSLKKLAKLGAGQRGVCGAVWGDKDIAYRCQTCEQDPTCAICVTCFQNGNHKDHDYSIIYTGGGCCDCGDVTAWKPEGFCTKHKGVNQIQPLPEQIANSIGPVLDFLFGFWREKLLSLEMSLRRDLRNDSNIQTLLARNFSSCIIEMLLSFCKHSESLLNFISKRMLSLTGLLDILIKAEQLLHISVVRKLHELMLKLLGEPSFKYEFAKIFIGYYPAMLNMALKESSNRIFDHYPLLPMFSVQIFTVPTLTLQLVKDVNLLGVLLGCLGDLFLFCMGEDAHLQINKWADLLEPSIRVIGDIHYVLSHSEVSKYVFDELREIPRTWMRLLAVVQGMDPQKRVKGLHVEEENENVQIPFILGRYFGIINGLLETGAFSSNNIRGRKDNLVHSPHGLVENNDVLRHAKVGRLSRECPTSCIVQVPPPVTCLISECLKTIENCIGLDSSFTKALDASAGVSHSSDSIIINLMKSLSTIAKGRSALRTYPTPYGAEREQKWMSGTSSYVSCEANYTNFQESVLEENFKESNNMVGELGERHMPVVDYSMDLDGFYFLNLKRWPEIIYDVSLQQVSFHIPLHRLLSLLLQKILKRCCEESGLLEPSSLFSCSQFLEGYDNFFGKIFRECHPNGFSAFVMEHPLRVRVACAQIRAGMWRKNGDPALISLEWYRSVGWSDQGLEFDLFLLQCCAALASPELYVKRIVERFGMLSYLSLNLERPNEYESTLAQEMLTLIIQIIQERRYCGLNCIENLQRELICRLATGDATHSQLVKYLPRDLSKSDQLQIVLDTVAHYANPTGFKQGKYSLRSLYWKELDLYHPRWNLRDLQLAEERYLRFCNVPASCTQLPQWTKIYYPLHTICRVATSKAVLQIIRAVLFYAYFSDGPSLSRAPDGVLLAALHLLYLSLDICHMHKQSHVTVHAGLHMGTNGKEAFPILDYACEEIDDSGSNGAYSHYSWKHQSMLSLLVLLMRKFKRESKRSEINHCNFVGLFEKILKKISELDERCMRKLQNLAADLIDHLSELTPHNGTGSSVSGFHGEQQKAKIRERQAAVLEKMKAAQLKFVASLKSRTSDVIDSSTSDQDKSAADVSTVTRELVSPTCSLCHDPDSKNPVCFLVFLQKSRLASYIEREPPSWEDVDKPSQEQSISKLAMQIPSDDEYLKGRLACSQVVHLGRSADEFDHDGQAGKFLNFIKSWLHIRDYQLPDISQESKAFLSPEILDNDVYRLIRSGLHEMTLHWCAVQKVDESLILGRKDDHMAGKHAESVVLNEYASFLSRGREKYSVAFESKNFSRMGVGLSHSVGSGTFDGFGPSDCDGIHISSCGHAVHQECCDHYLSSLRQRLGRRSVFERGYIVDPDQGEFLCPVCRRLANSTLPVMSVLHENDWRNILHVKSSVSSSDENAATFTSDRDNDCNIFYTTLILAILRIAANEVGQSICLKCSSIQSNKMTETVEPLFHTLSKLYYPTIHEEFLASGRLASSVLLWDVLRYTLISTEIAARCRGLELSAGCADSYLRSLYKELDSSPVYVLLTLLKSADVTRNEDCLHILLRFRSIQLFAKSITFGVSADDFSADTTGNIYSVLRHAEEGGIFPDVHVWKRAADPVLAHDPFSSLMWVLFCLPSPFLSSAITFVSLVHLFYIVCVIQALITLVLSHYGTHSKLQHYNGLTKQISEIMGNSIVAKQYFVSSHISCSGDVNEILRGFTCPYLRRCGMLWSLLKSSSQVPSCSYRRMLDEHLVDENVDILTDLPPEFGEIKLLERLFKIVPLEVLLNDEVVHTLALRWCEHFSRDFGGRSYNRVMPTTPEVPFRLMRLPHLYHDLLERYIKERCPNCNVVPLEAAVCLICGRLCCPSWKPCCRENECPRHAVACGAGIGVFLLIRKTTILLLRSSRQAPWPSPYLDAFGEEDVDMSRGRPLYLNEERYAALTHMVASHGLDRSSEVLRQTTFDTVFMV